MTGMPNNFLIDAQRRFNQFKLMFKWAFTPNFSAKKLVGLPQNST